MPLKSSKRIRQCREWSKLGRRIVTLKTGYANCQRRQEYLHRLFWFTALADCLEAEQFVHAMLESSGHRVTSNREFFHATVQEATDAVLKAKASLGGADAEPAPPRIAAMPRRVMRCSATTLWSSFRTQRRHMTTRIGALARCRTRMSTMRVWSCSLLQRRM